MAPSAMNTQPWNFYVLENKKKQELIQIMHEAIIPLKERLNSLFKYKMVTIIEKYFTNFGNSSHIIIVTCEKLENKVYHTGAIKSASAAIQNLCLAAHEEGLGTCWMSGILFVEDEILKFLGCENQSLVSAIVIGYPDQDPPIPPRKEHKIIFVD